MAIQTRINIGANNILRTSDILTVNSKTLRDIDEITQ